jgi:hypothetical protein
MVCYDPRVGLNILLLDDASDIDLQPLIPVHMKTLMAHVELGRTLSRKVNPDAFLFKAIKGS